jgi:hypothetical protein
LEKIGSSKKVEKAGARNDVMRHAQRHQLLGAASDSVMIYFSRKNISFYFNHPHDPDVRLRSQKVGNLKDFDVHGVPEKELPHNGQKSYQPVRHDHLPDVKRKVPT